MFFLQLDGFQSGNDQGLINFIVIWVAKVFLLYMINALNLSFFAKEYVFYSL